MFVDEETRRRLARKRGRKAAMTVGEDYVDVVTGWSGRWGGGAQLNDDNQRCVGLINIGPKGVPESRYCVDKHCVPPDPVTVNRRR